MITDPAVLNEPSGLPVPLGASGPLRTSGEADRPSRDGFIAQEAMVYPLPQTPQDKPQSSGNKIRVHNDSESTIITLTVV